MCKSREDMGSSKGNDTKKLIFHKEVCITAKTI